MSLDEPISMFKKPNQAKFKYYKIPARNFPKCEGFSTYIRFKNREEWAGPCQFRARYQHEGKSFCKKHLPR